MDNLTYYAIIVAGGAGKRMKTELPKQFLNIAGKPILMHTIEKFSKSKYKPNIILVLSKDDIEIWKNKVEEYQFNIPHQIINGGAERFFSVKNGFNSIQETHSIIAIHDAVRPLVSVNTIDKCFEQAAINGNAITAISSKDSIRISKESGNYAVPRNQVHLIQTPQTFIYNQLYKAYQQDFSNNFTDDASVVESYGYEIFLEEGDQSNMKVTFPEDLVLAEALIKAQI